MVCCLFQKYHEVRYLEHSVVSLPVIKIDLYLNMINRIIDEDLVAYQWQQQAVSS